MGRSLSHQWHKHLAVVLPITMSVITRHVKCFHSKIVTPSNRSKPALDITDGRQYSHLYE